MKKLTLIALALTFFACEKEQKVNYATVEINGQIWMAHNLRETKLNDGTPANYIEYGDPETYGYLYTFHDVETGKLCPAGWRMPRLKDFESLVLGLDTMEAATHLKSVNHWNTAGLNTLGFNAVGTGLYLTHNYIGHHEMTAFWTITPHTEEYTHVVVIYDTNPMIFWAKSVKSNGLAVRCIKN